MNTAFDFIAIQSQNAHSLAVLFLEHLSSMAWFYQAFLLGADQKLLAHSDWVRGFYVTGLYHLLVVSGSHLSMLARVVDLTFIPFKKTPPKLLTGFILFIFLFLNRFQAGAFRAFICFALPKQWPQTFKLFVSWVVLTAGFSNSTQIWSLILSVAGVLGMELSGFFLQSPQTTKPSFFVSIRPALIRSLCCTLVSAPILFSLSPCLSWLIVPVNTFLLPILEIFLLPSSLLALAISPIQPAFESLTLSLGHFLEFLSTNHRDPQMCVETKGRILCFQFYSLCIFICIWLFRIRLKRKNWQRHFIKKSIL